LSETSYSDGPITSAAFAQFMMDSTAGAPSTSSGGASATTQPAYHLGGVEARAHDDANGGPDSGAGKMAVHPASFGDARGIMPMYTDDPGSVAHQLEDLSWTDYFSKFLDDIGGGTPMSAGPTSGSGSVVSHSYNATAHAHTPVTNLTALSHSPAGSVFNEMPFGMGSPTSPANHAAHSQSPRRSIHP
jgi:hypothetical protein